MPPKKKPTSDSSTTAAASTSTSTTTSSTTTATPTPTTPVITPSSSSSTSNGGKIVKWYWAGDSNTGTQDTLVEYDAAMTTSLETAYQYFITDSKVDRCKVDQDRYVDFTAMSQRRYDDPSKQRSVDRKELDANSLASVVLTLPQRVVPNKKVTKKVAAKKPAAAKKGKKRGHDESDSDSSESESEDEKDDESRSESESSEDDSDDDEDYHASWYWAGDSGGGPAKGGGHQDIWIKYDLDFAKKLEKALNNGDAKVKVDADRFVDIQNMLQRRYDDENKRRSIKREDAAKLRQPKKKTKMTTTTIVPGSNGTPTTSTTTTTSGTVPAASATMSQSLALSQAIKCPSSWVDVSMDYKEIDVYPQTTEFNWMSDLFTQTISSIHKGGSPLNPIVFNSLKVTRVVRIQNASIWLRYNHRKEKILGDNNGKCTPVPKIITNITNGPEVDTKANECFLFHGLNVSSITGITKFGFDPRFCSLEGMFGAGLYFAENSSKSNQYCHAGACTCSGFQATSCRCTLKDEVCLLVCRVTLGEPLIENVFRGNAKGDFWYGRRTEPKRPDGINIYNSVIGESKPNYGPKATLQLREYIVYESGQVYPEYKVYFKRVK